MELTRYTKISILKKHMPLIMYRACDNHEDPLEKVFDNTQIMAACQAEGFTINPKSFDKFAKGVLKNYTSAKHEQAYTLETENVIMAENLQDQIYGEDIPHKTPLAEALTLKVELERNLWRKGWVRLKESPLATMHHLLTAIVALLAIIGALLGYLTSIAN